MKLIKMSKPSSKESSPGQESSSSGITGGSSSSTSASLLKVHMEDEFTILKLLAEGTFSKVYLAKRSSSECSSFTERLVLKAIHSELSSVEEFTRELQLTYFLSPHPNIVTCYNVSFMWNNCFVFVQEHAPFGSLSRFIKKGNGLPESQVKLVSQQVVSALEFMHQMNLVHRDVTPHNVLVFKSSMSLVKLCDFGCTRAQGSLVVRTDSSSTTTNSYSMGSGGGGSSHLLMSGPLVLSSFAPPEISDLLPQEKYHCAMSSDVWQVGILIFTCLTGSPPWTCADITDSGYRHYESWLRRKSLKIPEPLKPFSPRFVRLFKRLLEPKASQRSEVREVFKYLKDDWFRRKRPATISSSGSYSLERQDGIKTSAATKTQKRHSQDDCSNNHLCLDQDKSAGGGGNRLSIRCNGGSGRISRSGQSNTSKQASYCGGGHHQEDAEGNHHQCRNYQQKGSYLLLKEFGVQTEIDKKRVEDWIVSTTADQQPTMTVLKDQLV